MRTTPTVAAVTREGAEHLSPAAPHLPGRQRQALRELVADGTLSVDQADAVLARLDAAAADRSAGTRRWLAEVAGYLGGTLTLAGAAMLVRLSWHQLSRPGQVTLLLAATATLIAAGVLVAGGPWALRLPAIAPSTARRRVAAVLLAVSAGTAAMAAVVAVTDHQAVAGGAAGLLVAAAGYLLLPALPLLLAAATFSVVTGTAITGDFIGDSPLQMGLALVTVAAVWATLGASGVAAHRSAALAIAGITGLVGAQQPLGEAGAAGWAYLLTTLVAAACLAGYVLLRLGCCWRSACSP